MPDILIALAFIAMIATPAVVAVNCIKATDDSDQGTAPPARPRVHPRMRGVAPVHTTGRHVTTTGRHGHTTGRTVRTARNLQKSSPKIALRSPTR
jgi:hypothetical protein